MHFVNEAGNLLMSMTYNVPKKNIRRSHSIAGWTSGTGRSVNPEKYSHQNSCTVLNVNWSKMEEREGFWSSPSTACSFVIYQHTEPTFRVVILGAVSRQRENCLGIFPISI